MHELIERKRSRAPSLTKTCTLNLRLKTMVIIAEYTLERKEGTDILTPYKHYETEIISGVIDGVVSPDDEATEDDPCQMTMERWLVWFRINIRRIEGYLRQISTSLHMNLAYALFGCGYGFF